MLSGLLFEDVSEDFCSLTFGGLDDRSWLLPEISDDGVCNGDTPDVSINSGSPEDPCRGIASSCEGGSIEGLRSRSQLLIEELGGASWVEERPDSSVSNRSPGGPSRGIILGGE